MLYVIDFFLGHYFLVKTLGYLPKKAIQIKI